MPTDPGKSAAAPPGSRWKTFTARALLPNRPLPAFIKYGLASALTSALVLLAAEITVRQRFAEALDELKPLDAILDLRSRAGAPLFIEKPNGLYATDMESFQGILRAQRQEFKMPKPEGTYRIFCLGESSVVGCPCPAPPETGFPFKLQKLLRGRGRNVEVINAGIAGATSTEILDVAGQVVNFSPDLIVLYAGHNEHGYYFWSKDVLDKPFLRARLSLDKYLFKSRLYRYLLSKTHEQARSFRENFFKYSPLLDEETATPRLQEVVKILSGQFKGSIPPEDWRRFAAAELHLSEAVFARNVSAMAEAVRKSGAAFAVCTIVSNIRDFPPVFSFHGNDFSPQNTRWMETRSRAEAALERKDYPAAIGLLEELVEIDPNYADTFYSLGKAHYALGNHDEARKNFVLARDKSPAYAPFQRAPSSMNNAIRRLARKNGALLIDVEKSFYSLPGGLGVPGNDLFEDNLHPTDRGYSLLAEIIADAIAREVQLPSNKRPPSREGEAGKPQIR